MRHIDHSIKGANSLEGSKFENNIEVDLLESLSVALAETNEISNKARICYIVGFGSQPNNTYSKLKKESGIRVIWDDFVGPWWTKFFSLFIAGRMGLIEIIDKKEIPKTFKVLTHMGMAGLYSFDRNFRNEFVKEIISNKWKANLELLLIKDKSSMCLLVDGDSYESETGISAMVFYENECPNELINVLEKIRH